MKILLISYWFPPSRAIGAKRWGEFYELSKNDKDLDITVLTVNWNGAINNDHGINFIGDKVDYKTSKSIHSDGFINTLKHPTLMLRSVDRSLLTSWYKEGKQWIESSNDNFDLIVSSFGPIGSVLLGSYAKNKYKAPYIIDLRDLISIQGQKKKIPFVNMIDKTLDKYLTRKADSFFVVSPTGNKKAANFYDKDVVTIFNGLSNKISDNSVDLSIRNVNKINILYAGGLSLNRDPVPILKILNAYARKSDISITVRFATPDEIFQFINKDEFQNIQIKYLGYLSKDELRVEMDNSDALLVLEDQRKKGNENLTGKIFEYLHAKKPIIASCNKASDIAYLLKNLNAGSLIKNEDDLIRFINEKRALDISKCNFYSRENQYKLMKEYFYKIL